MPSKNWIILLVALSLGGCAGGQEKKEPTAEEMYATAKKNMDNKNWLTAIDELRELEAKYPYGKHAEQAQLDTIYANYRNDNTGPAIAAAERFIKLHPTHPAVDYAYYLKGLANYQEKDSLFGRLTGRDDLSDRDASISRTAFDAFTDVYTLFPNSRYAADSRARAHHLHNSLARHELTVATYYFSRDAHVAVIHRAKGIIEDYASTSTVEDALALLAFAYGQMGLSKLSTDAKRVLTLNFPASEYHAAFTDSMSAQVARELFERKLGVPTSSRKAAEKKGFW